MESNEQTASQGRAILVKRSPLLKTVTTTTARDARAERNREMTSREARRLALIQIKGASAAIELARLDADTALVLQEGSFGIPGAGPEESRMLQGPHFGSAGGGRARKR